MRQLFGVLTVILLTSAGNGGEATSQQIWAERIRGKPASAVLDSHEVIQMIAFTGRKGTKIAPRSAAIASALFRTCGVRPLRGPIQLESILQQAVSNVGRTLTPAETETVADFHKRCLADYYKSNPANTSGKMPIDITFGLKDVRHLNNTIQNEQAMSDALGRLSALHGWHGQIHVMRDISFDFLRSALIRKVPVLFERDGTFRVCFGFLQSNRRILLFLFLPESMPFQAGQIRLSKMDMESIRWEVVNMRKQMAKRMKGKSREDYQISTSKQIPAEGFLIEPFVKGKYTAYVLMNWRESAAAHDAQLRKLLKLPEPKPKQFAKLPAQQTDRDLWEYYILGKEEALDGPYSLVPSVVFPSGGYLNQQYACLTSSIATQQGAAVGNFTLSIRKFYRGACKLLKDDFLLLKGDKKTRMMALVDGIRKQYEARQKGIEPIVEELSDPYMVSALRIKRTMAPTVNIEKGLESIERLHGWKALLETAQNVPFDKYQEGIHKRIPIVLKDTAKNDWLLCIGYLRHNDTDMLLLVNPGMIDKSKSLHIDNQRLYPGRGVYFEKFEQKKYQPYFIHNWRISVDAYKEQIAAIFGKGDTAPRK